jgi:hypothetical protein
MADVEEGSPLLHTSTPKERIKIAMKQKTR